MTDSSSLPVAGWYDDPEIALRLRWWDGKKWSQHTRPKPIMESAAAPSASSVASAGSVSAPAGTGTDPSGTSTIAAPTGEDPYSYSVPFSFTPASAPGSAPASAASAQDTSRNTPGPNAPGQLGTFGARAVSHRDLWNTMGESVDYAPERTTTVSAWMLAATPLVAFIAQLAVTILTGLESTPWFWLVASGLMPILWIIVFVRRDREKLHEWGHLQRASAWWALLGSYGYLTARGIVVQRQAGRGWWPLIVTILITAALVSLGVFSPALILVFLTPVS